MAKVENFDAVITVLNEAAASSDLIEFIENEKAMAIRKAEKAKERQAEKKQAGDELRGVIQNTLSTEKEMTLQEIVDAINDPEVTSGKVRARVSQLVELGIAIKESVPVVTIDDDGNEKKKKAMAYRLAE